MEHARGLLDLSAEAAAALAAGRPVVALESTIVTHGLPRPQNLEAALRSEHAVREAGAVPATVALRQGRIRVGLSEGELAELAATEGLAKVSAQSLAAALARPQWAGTTVAATLIASAAAGIGVFATGGIGGVHRGGQETMDVSADLPGIARTDVAVVCSGPKSILDVDRTLEVLETLGVPVVGWATDELPGFLARSSGRPVVTRVDTPEEAATLIRRQRSLGLGGVLICVQLPEDVALPREEADAAIERATREAAAARVHGPASTPWILARVAQLTRGRSVIANLALIERNAGVAARIAVALAEPPQGGTAAPN
jgi:pseudouridylate synthase